MNWKCKKLNTHEISRLIFGCCFLFYFDVKKADADKKELEINIINITKAILKKDTATLNKYIDTTVGFYVIPPFGVLYHLGKQNRIDFNDYNFQQGSFGDIKKQIPKIKFTTLPNYDCDKSKWNKKGLYASKSTFLSDILAKEIKEGESCYGESELNKIKALEKNSYWVTYAQDDGSAIEFSITFLNNKYYLTGMQPVPLYCDI